MRGEIDRDTRGKKEKKREKRLTDEDESIDSIEFRYTRSTRGQ